MGLKDLFDKGKCLVGLHKGEWKAPSRTSCNFVRVCERCAAQHKKTEHIFAEWAFVADGQCDQKRKCTRCGAKEQRITHAFGAAEYVKAHHCERRQRCARCRATQAAGVAHVMDRWRYVDASGCAQVQQCSRCNADGATRRTAHDWAEWQHSNALNCPVRVCRRCGEMESRPAPVAAAQLASAGAARAPAAPASAASSRGAGASRDQRLLGHWRHTDARGGSFSYATDLNYVFDEGGRCAHWTVTASQFGKQRSETFQGTWFTEANTLHVRFDDGDVFDQVYQVDGGHMNLPHANAKYWERVG